MSANDEAPPRSKSKPPPPPPGSKRRSGASSSSKLPPPPKKRSVAEPKSGGSRPLPDLKLKLKESRVAAKSPSAAQPAVAKPITPPRVSNGPVDNGRGNVVPAVAGEMLVGPGEEDRTHLHRLPPGGDFSDIDEDGRTLAVQASELRRELASSSDTVSTVVLEAYVEEAQAAIEHFEAALVGESDEERVGRYHYEIARLCETVLGDLGRASAHYGRALEATPERLPVIVGARRVMLARGQSGNALELFDRELRVTADRGAKASLMFVKARVLEDQLDRAADARDLYTAAAELAASDPVLIKATEQADWTLEDWAHLAETYGDAANAVGSDPRHRAALVVRRARQLEVHREDIDGAAQLYEDALDIDREAGGALQSLKRLHHDRKRWRELIRVLETEGETTSDPVVRVMAQYRVGQIHAERLGNRKEAIAALESATRDAPDQPFVLDGLARLYEQAGSYPALATTLARLVESTTDARERLGHLHRIGELCRDELRDDNAAIEAYEAALQLDPTYVPALRSLAPMYARQEKWDLLVQIHEREAEATNEPGRRAIAHARAAEILEREGRRVEAIGHHEHALALDPALASSFRALLRLYSVTEDHHKLIELHERAIDHVDVTRRIDHLFAIGDLYRGPLGDAEQAEAAYRRILKLDPKHLGAVHALQRTAEGVGRWRQLVEALELETRIIKDRSETVALLYRAGCVLQEQLDVRHEAVARFKRVLELDATHRPTLAALGRIHHAQGHWADLVEVYARELGVCDASSKVALLHKMGDVYSRFLADPTKAADCFRRALAIEPRHAPSVHALGRIFTDRGAWAELVELTEKEQQHAEDPGSRAVAAFRAGEIYEEHLDDQAAAERAFCAATALRPGDESAAEALARVRTQLQHWKELAAELEARADASEDPERAVGLLLRAAEVWFDRVGSVEPAIAAYEKVLAHRPEHLGALLGVEPLYRRAKRWPELSDTYARQVRVLVDPGAKAAALTERARVLELHLVGSTADLVDCYMGVLAFRPTDRGVLEGLERVAMSSADPSVLADVDARLAESVSDAELKSAYLTRQAEAMETSGQPQALDVYRKAMRLDPGNRGALRGLARVAELIGHGKAMVEAAEAEAGLAKDPAVAAGAWVRAGVVQVDRLDDRSAAVRAFEKALALWPDHVDAADRLTALMSRNGEYEMLVERIGRAASEASQAPRQHALWVQASRIHARELSNLGAALSALRKLVELQPTNAVALFELGALLHSDRRFEEAIDLLTSSLETDPEPEVSQQAHALLAASHEAQGDPARAHRHYEMALKLAPNDHELLQRVVNLQMADEAFDQAAQTATRLVQVSRNDTERCRSLVLLARAKQSGGELADAVAHLSEAIVLEGTRGRAHAEVVRIATTTEVWASYVAALRIQIERRGLEAEQAAPLYLEIAEVQHDRLEAAEDAMATLAEGLRQCASDPTLRYALAKRLHQARRYGDAVEQFQYLLMDEVHRPEAWRSLSETYAFMGRERERLMALSSVAVLGDATSEERTALGAWRSRTNAVGAGVLRDDVLAELFVAREQLAPLAKLLAAMADGLGRIRAPDLTRYGVSGRDKLGPRSEHPLRGLCDRLAASFGVEDYDVYLHHVLDRPAVVENTPRPSLILPNWMTELSRSGQVFIVARSMFMLSRGIHAIGLFSPAELEQLLAAAARHAMPNYGQRVASAEVLDDKLKLILKGLPRRRRKGFEAAAEAYARARPLDINTSVQWARQTARRVALLVADDLPSSLSALDRIEDLGSHRGAELVKNNPVVADLLKVWVSKPAMGVRRKLGLLEVAQPRAAGQPPAR